MTTPIFARCLQQEFTEAGYTRASGRKRPRGAGAASAKKRPGLVILDVMMPEMNGFDVAAVLKNDPATMDIPIIILSIVEDKERGFRLGVDRYLTKPIDTASLFHEVGALLDQGKSKKKVMVVDEDASTIRTLTDVLADPRLPGGGIQRRRTGFQSRFLQARHHHFEFAAFEQPGSPFALRFEKGLENVLFLIYQ